MAAVPGLLAALFLGSNLGDRESCLAEAASILQARGLVDVLSASPLYETQPVETGPQPWFLNRVLLVVPRVPPGALLASCLRVEAFLGRRRAQRRGPRTIDLDLLLFGGLSLRTPFLTLPHPALPKRRCILIPLADVAPAWRHPVLGKTVLELVIECRDPGLVRRVGE